ncbi:hypothetical protein ACVWYK_007062 [Bradyrhizobium sp. USDA 4470]
MKYLVAGNWEARLTTAPCKSLKKLPGFAGNSNVTDVT